MKTMNIKPIIAIILITLMTSGCQIAKVTNLQTGEPIMGARVDVLDAQTGASKLSLAAISDMFGFALIPYPIGNDVEIIVAEKDGRKSPRITRTKNMTINIPIRMPGAGPGATDSNKSSEDANWE